MSMTNMNILRNKVTDHEGDQHLAGTKSLAIRELRELKVVIEQTLHKSHSLTSSQDEYGHISFLPSKMAM